MRLNVRVIPRSSKNELTILPDGSLKAKLTVPPVEGAANEKLVELVAKRYEVAKTRVTVIKGAKGKNKIIEII